MSLREQVKTMVGEDEPLNPEEFSNLILDELKVERLSLEDKKFLEEFTNLELLSLNQTNIKSTANFPDAPNLVRLELNDNKLPGSELKNLTKYQQLRTLKFANNLICDFTEIEALKGLSNLVNLDMGQNPIEDKENYREKVFKLFPNLMVLDGVDKDGNEIQSEDEEEDYGEEDEDDDEEGEEGVVEDEDDDEEEGDFDDYGEEDDEGDEDEEANLGKRKY